MASTASLPTAGERPAARSEPAPGARGGLRAKAAGGGIDGALCDPPPAASPAPPPPAAPAAAGWPLRLIAAVAVLLILPLAKQVLLPLVIAVLLAVVFCGPVRALQRRGIPEPLGAGLVVLALVGALAVMLLGLAGPATEWLARAPANIAQLMQSFERLRDAVPLLHGSGAGSGEAGAFGERLASEGVNLTRAALGQATSLAVGAASTLILLYFLLASENWLLVRLMQRLRSRADRLRGLTMGRCAQRDIARYLLTMAMINIALGLMTGLALWVIGLPNPTLWAAVTAVLNFAPYLGPATVTALLLLAGVLTFDAFGMMVAPPLAFLALNALECYLLSPLVVGRRLDLNPVFVFLSVMFWGWAWGIAGTLIAVPMLLALRHACRASRSLRPLSAWLARPAGPGKTIAALLEPEPRWWRRRTGGVPAPLGRAGRAR